MAQILPFRVRFEFLQSVLRGWMISIAAERKTAARTSQNLYDHRGPLVGPQGCFGAMLAPEARSRPDRGVVRRTVFVQLRRET